MENNNLFDSTESKLDELKFKEEELDIREARVKIEEEKLRIREERLEVSKERARIKQQAQEFDPFDITSGSNFNTEEDICDDKPVIYLYPEHKTEVEVELDFDGDLTCTYPKSEGKWKVVAHSDGKIECNDRVYNYLFWEGKSNVKPDFKEGYCVPGYETEEFLERMLPIMGLSDSEMNEFIVYWLPKMERNNYNLISFQKENYVNSAKLKITPTPDTVIRVFMSWKGMQIPVTIAPQKFEYPIRKGFTVVEWGGSEVKDNLNKIKLI